MRNLLILALAAATIPAWSSASERGEEFTFLFAKTCMAHFYSQDKLRTEMSQKRTPIVPEKQAAFFLGGTQGTAWLVGGDGGDYVVALRDDGVCALFARRAPAAEVQASFSAAVSQAPEPMVAASVASAGPSSGVTKTIAYSWSRPKDKVQLLFTLTTSTADDQNVQAMASMALTKKPN